jgi:cytidylate kinase
MTAPSDTGLEGDLQKNDLRPRLPSGKMERTASPDLSAIEVLAFVGAAGTGKSQRASQVARQYGVDFVIDDGLVVSKGQIMAGRSAKSEKNLVRAIRRALFEYTPHRTEVVTFLASRGPCRVMVIATSVSMMEKIVKKLGLNPPGKILDITEVASSEEIHNALKERREKKQHVVPVSRTQIQRNFAGKLVSQLKDLFKTRDRQDESRTVVKPPFSFDGRVIIEEEAIIAMIRRLIVMGDHIRQVRELTIVPEGDVLNVNLVLDLKLGNKSALYIGRLLQKKLSVGLSFFTGIEVKKVNVTINEFIL